MKNLLLLFIILFGINLYAECSDVVCAIYCPNGVKKDENGCEVCACNPSSVTLYSGYRYSSVPDFILNPFFDNFESVTGHSFFVQTSFKNNNFAYIVELDYTNFSANNGYWNQDDKLPDYFILDVGYLNLGVNFSWFIPLNAKFELISSFGIGLGAVFGTMDKYDTNGERPNPKDFEKEDKLVPVFGHLLIAFGFQYEVHRINDKPLFIKFDMGFKDALFSSFAIGYGF